VKFVFHDGYFLDIGPHVFPAEKYRLLHQHLLRTGLAKPADFVPPEPATDEDVRLAHHAAWVEKLRRGTLTVAEMVELEIPYSPDIVRAFWLAAGGSILAARLALRDGIGFNLGGGFHHAFPDHGEGFCAINDIAIAIRRLQKDEAVQRAMVVDCDVHHGNGTAAIFADDSSVYTLSIHQRNNYPSVKPPSDMDIHLSDGTGDEEYLLRLGNGCRAAFTMFRPELLVYVAGADPYREDQLGGLALTFEGLEKRDRLVINMAREHGVPVAVVLAGGYARNTADTIAIHANTARIAAELS
jgi:acetoin utilization deacetylase AcuC-like enzyme